MIKVVSVVKDKAMYSRCIADNPNLDGCVLCPSDNSVENLPVTVRYNRFLEENRDECWLVFCHEDWHPDAPLKDVVEGLDPSRLYGPVGVFLMEREKTDIIVMKGGVRQCNKAGTRCTKVRGVENEGLVDTFDCQCIMMHSSLVDRCALRFDENLAFDMYVEDFCVSAHRNHGIESFVIPMPCTHFSRGVIGDRFFKALEYERCKWSSSDRRYATIAGHHNTFGGDASKRVIKPRPGHWKILKHFLK